ncbi:MAG: LPS export ABC transporter permease LptF [Deltaproteobacteria bacterium]|nr:LPS export ABC transporter permease LptF [Deltaproteobacteria bacterium]
MRAVLDRYLLTECLPTLGLSLGAFTFVILMHRLLKLADLVVAKGVPLGTVLELLALALPPLLPLLLPVSLLLSVLLAMGRMSADSEIVAMRACGVSLAENVRPVLALSAAVCLLAGGISLWAQPASTRAFKSLLYESVKNRLSVMTQAGIFTELAEGVTVYAEGLRSETEQLRNLFVYLEKAPSRGVWIFAEEGAISETQGGLRLDLRRGEMHQTPGRGMPYRRLRFATYELVISLPSAVAASLEAEETSTPDLFRAALGPGTTRDARLELHRRLAIPVSCLVLGILGAALGVHHSRAGKSRGFVVCLGVVFAYYTLLTAGRVLGQRGVFGPELAMWLPDLVLGAAAAYAFVRKSREAPLPLEDTVARLVRALARRVASARGLA